MLQAAVLRRIAAVVADGAMPTTPLDGVARIMAAIVIVIGIADAVDVEGCHQLGVMVLHQSVPAQEPGVAVGVTFGRPREPINRLARAIFRLSRTHTSILLPTPWERAVSAAATRPMQKTCKSSIRGSVKTCL